MKKENAAAAKSTPTPSEAVAAYRLTFLGAPRGRAFAPNTPVVLLTAGLTDELRASFHRWWDHPVQRDAAGFIFHFERPITPAEDLEQRRQREERRRALGFGFSDDRELAKTVPADSAPLPLAVGELADALLGEAVLFPASDGTWSRATVSGDGELLNLPGLPPRLPATSRAIPGPFTGYVAGSSSDYVTLIGGRRDHLHWGVDGELAFVTSRSMSTVAELIDRDLGPVLVETDAAAGRWQIASL